MVTIKQKAKSKKAVKSQPKVKTKVVKSSTVMLGVKDEVLDLLKTIHNLLELQINLLEKLAVTAPTIPNDSQLGLFDKPLVTGDPVDVKSVNTHSKANGAAKPPTVSKEECMQALQKVSAEHGLDKVKSVLSQFKAERMSEVKEADYPAFVKACLEVKKETSTLANFL